MKREEKMGIFAGNEEALRAMRLIALQENASNADWAQTARTEDEKKLPAHELEELDIKRAQHKGEAR